MRTKALLGLLGACALVAACAHTDASPRDTSASLRIEKLDGSVVRLGSWNGYPLLGARLHARVCLASATEARRSHPDELRFTHFLVSGPPGAGPPRRWSPVRTVSDRPHWLVPLGETWRGACGPLVVEDAIPPARSGGVESLGNPLSCYGIELTVRVGDRRTSKRVLIQCGGLNRADACSPDDVEAPPSVVGLVIRAAVERLREAGFRTTVFPNPEASPNVPPGVVVEQEPASICKGADVWLVVSTSSRR
jgi:hypothetical protein